MLIGAGALWLFASRVHVGPLAAAGGARLAEAASTTGRAASDAVRSTWRSATDNAADLAARARDAAAAGGAQLAGAASGAVRSTWRSARDNGGDFVGANDQFGREEDDDDTAEAVTARLRDQGGAVRQRVAQGFTTGAESLASARAQLSEALERQPLALGLVGLAIGAALAAALPPTDVENKYLGETSDALREEAGRQMDRATGAASAAAEKAMEEAQVQGFTMDSLKGEAANAATKLGKVAQSAAQTMRERTASSP